MNQKILYLISPLFLTGCIGSLIGGYTERLCDEYPDIRTVPEREEASAPRGLHEGEEKASREIEFKNLEQAREQIKARDQALRERTFPNAQKEEPNPPEGLEE